MRAESHHFLVYWKNIEGNFEFDAPLDHAWSLQFKRVVRGDTLWIVTIVEGTPYLLGRLRVRDIFRSGGVLHARAARPMDVARRIPIRGALPRLRFDSDHPKLRPASGGRLAQQLQSIRRLSSGSVRLLSKLLISAKAQSSSAPNRSDPRAAAAVLAALIPARTPRLEVLKALANSIEAAHASGPGSWSVSLFDDFLRLNVGPIEVLTIGPGLVRLLTLDRAMNASARRRLKKHLSFDVKYRSVPGRKGKVRLKPAEFAGAYRPARAAHEELCERAAGLRSRSSFRNSYSEGVLLMLEAVTRRKLSRPEYFAPPTHVLIVSNRDEATIDAGVGHTRTLRDWVVPKVAQRGDAALFFSRGNGVIADGVIAVAPHPGRRIGRRPALRASVTSVRTWVEPISIDELRAIRGWRWLDYPRGFTTVPEAVCPDLWALIRRRKSRGRPESLEAKVEAAFRASGGGFGTPEENRKVEKAAIAFVRRQLKKEGWAVDSVEQEKCGYDLKCRRKNARRHVEVKGISGTKCEFIITMNERVRAQEDAAFFLYVVTGARSAAPRLEILTDRDLQRRFSLRPIAYRATPSR